MADYTELKAAIRAAIFDNTEQAITGESLQEILVQMVDELGESYVLPEGGIPASDLAQAVRDALAEAVSAYQLPVGGIPEADLAQAVRNALAAGLSAYQKPQSGIPSADLAQAVRDALAAALSAYQKPSAGIPKTDLSQGVQNSLNKADEALTQNDIADNLTTEDSTKVLSAKQGKVLAGQVSQLGQKSDGLATFTKTNNLLDLSKITEGYFWYDYAHENSDYYYTDKIPVVPGVTYTVQADVSVSNRNRLISFFRFVNGYTANGGQIAAMRLTNVQSFTATEDCAYVIVTGHMTGLERRPAIFASDSIQPYEPFGYFAALKENTVPEGALKKDAVQEKNIKDSAVSLRKVSFVKFSKNLFNPNDPGVMLGYYQADAAPTANSSYNLTGYIEVEPGTKYVFSWGGNRTYPRFISYFATNQGSPVSYEASLGVVTIPSNAHYMRISVPIERWDMFQVEKGEENTTYEAYSAPHISVDALPIGIPAKYPSFAVAKTLGAGESANCDYYNSSVGFMVTGKIIGAFTSISLGLGYNSFYGYWIEVDGTSVTLKHGNDGAVVRTLAHGLTFGNITYVSFYRINYGEIAVRITNDYGGEYSSNLGNYPANGAPFIRNNGSDSVDVNLRYELCNLRKAIMVCGDSYWSVGDTARLPHHLLDFQNYSLIAIGGGSASSLGPQVINAISRGARPSYLVWAIGMNGGDDAASGPNATWLSRVQGVLSLCESVGVTPILCTIPTVPGHSHVYLNQWVRESGYRCIDLAAAVEQDGTNTWRGWGTSNALLSSDQVHPTTAGAAQLAAQLLSQFPEIAIV